MSFLKKEREGRKQSTAKTSLGERILGKESGQVKGNWRDREGRVENTQACMYIHMCAYMVCVYLNYTKCY